MDLRAKTDDELVAILNQTLESTASLASSASEKFKQSELAEWDESLYLEGRELIEEVRRLFEQSAPVHEELERRHSQKVQELEIADPASQARKHDQRWYRKDLTTRTMPTTGEMDEFLPQALENLLSRVPKSWWREQRSLANEMQQYAALQPLLLCGRERWGTDFTTLHKYAYYLNVADSHLKKEPLLDIFAAARAVPQIFYLGISLEILKGVKGAGQKLRELYSAPSTETDARILELLVAAAFARMGHEVAFIETSAGKTADLRLYGMPIPIVIECKRRQAINAYEGKEFSIIHSVFAALAAERLKLGLVGELSIDFRQEIICLPVAGIVQSIRDITKSLSPYAEKETEWGTLHLRPVAISKDLEPTRLYSPRFLEEVFGIDLELGEFDGICAVSKNNQTPIVDRAELPFTMTWTSNSEAAKERKMQTVRNLWIEAVDQIPTGEAGLIYLAYEEGHRPSLADARTDAIRNLVDSIYFKRRAISIPMTVISRLFPNVVLEGRPDLIESAIPLVDGDRDDYDFWTAEMPTRIFTP